MWLLQNIRPFGFTESQAIDHAVQLSIDEHGGDEEQQPAIHSVPEEMSVDQFTETVKTHASQQIAGPNRNIVISRASIWATAEPYFKRKKFAEGKGLIQVTFATFKEEEDAVDLGGPRREFLHLLIGAICKQSKTVTGTFSYYYCLIFDSIFHGLNHASYIRVPHVHSRL